MKLQMKPQISPFSTGLVLAVRLTRAMLAKGWEFLAIAPAHTYRPEAHYMRGPGPKWREKHASRG